MTVRNQINEMLSAVPDGELPILLEVVRRFVPTNEDDIASANDIESHRIAMEEYLNGETVPHSAINWD